jgi:phage terminase large subunit GpA-like protein
LFCESYFPLTIHLDWSPDHLKVIGKIEQAVLHGGLFALAMPRGSGKSSIAETACVWHVLYDTNFWKSFVYARLAVAMGDRGCLSLFGDHPEQHRLFAEHLTAEYRVKTEGRGRTVDEWKQRPERGDNHWFDCLVGCAVAASIQGAVLDGTGGSVTTVNRKRISFAERRSRSSSAQRSRCTKFENVLI